MQAIRRELRSVIRLALKVAQILNSHPIHKEADSACVIARELLSLNAFKSGVVFGGTNKGLYKSGSA